MAKILLVEDDPMLLPFYTDLLTGEEYSVDKAADGEEGLRLASQGGYDLILLDLHLPKMEGPAIVAELAKHKPTPPNKKIVMLTNANEPEIEKKLAAFGVTTFLLKSALTPQDFLKEVKTALQ